MLSVILVVSLVLFAAAFFIYGRFLERRYDIDDTRLTPSHTDYDGIDRVPAKRAVLLGHHFSSIAGAGPVVGPILAATAFGWLPTILWVILGSIFIGGVHDFSALVASIRHKARSVAEIAKSYISPVSYRLLLAFTWLSLVYVLTVFTDLTAATFVEDGGVATSSILFMALAVGFGVFVYRLKVSVLRSTLIFVPLVFAAVWAGQQIPINADKVPVIIGGSAAKTWSMFLVLYCFIASTTPVWILLQPRDYLSSYLLYASVLGGFVGILFGGFSIEFPAIKGFYDPNLGSLVPIMFITVACGACSGFHSLVASGTSSKQIDRESDVKLIGYGAMLIEGVVAVLALATVAIVVKGDELLGKAPQIVYAAGMSRFLEVFGIPRAIGYSFGLLALSTFILTTLDTATRLGRYIFEEFFELRSKSWRYLSTAAMLVLPTIFVLITLKDAQGNPVPAWRVIWPIFGAANQLLAGLVLLVVAVWLKKTGKKVGFVIGPMVFMNVMTLWSLVVLLIKYWPFRKEYLQAGLYSAITIEAIAALLLILALVLVVESYKTVRKIVRV